jgi:glycosyltransferase involved in cell wall biosynthesis
LNFNCDGTFFMKRLWITWERQRRNHTLSQALNAKLYVIESSHRRIVRYFFSLWKTCKILWEEKPDILFVQNPSVVLSSFAVIYGYLINIPIVIDAHNAGIYPLNGKSKFLNYISDFLLCFANLVITTNKHLATHIEIKGGRSIVLPDPLPVFLHPLQLYETRGKYNVLFICSWADDEPYYEVIEAANLLNKDVCIYITGSNRGREVVCPSSIPENVVLTGYLEEQAFITMIYSCDIIMDLTRRENCLVCGAYEAVAAEKPLILSDTETQRLYFAKGVLFSQNESIDIARTINEAIVTRNHLAHEIKELKAKLIDTWEQNRKEAEEVLSGVRPETNVSKEILKQFPQI